MQAACPLYVVAGLTYHTDEHLRVCGRQHARFCRVTVDGRVWEALNRALYHAYAVLTKKDAFANKWSYRGIGRNEWTILVYMLTEERR